MLSSDPALTGKGAERRGEILETSLDLFLRKGFHGTSTREICRELGISSGLFFRYFPTKEAVYDELVRIGCQTMELDVAAGVAAPEAFLLGVVESTLDLVRTHRVTGPLFLFMNQAHYRPGISEVADQLLAGADIIRTSLPIFESGQRAGVFRDGPPLALSMAFWCAIQGLGEELAIHPDHPVPPADWYLDLIRAR